MNVFDLDIARAAPGFWYVGSPYSKYSAGLEAAFAEIARVTAALLKLGVGVFSPIAHTHPLAVFGVLDPLDHAIWLPADRWLMNAAHGLIIVQMQGWEESIGLSHEVQVFAAAGKPVVALPPAYYEPLVAAMRNDGSAKDAVALGQVAEELKRARSKFGFANFNGPHEGYAVILEEVDELWDDVRANRPEFACREAVQIAAMGARFVSDLGHLTSKPPLNGR